MRIALIITVLTIAALLPQFATAQGLIRDTEIEHTLNRIARPLLQKAGLPESTEIFIVNSPALNAFVAPGNDIFLNYGLIKKLPTVEMLQAVMAHEIGHITGGHIIQRSLQIASTRTAAGVGILLSLATALAGAPGAGVGLAIGSTSAAERSILTNTRRQETSADQSGVKYLAQAGIDPNAAIEVLKIFQGQDLLTAHKRDPYTLTHPLSQARIQTLKTLVETHAHGLDTTRDADIDYRYGRMRAKFDGFTTAPQQALRRLDAGDTSEVATLTRAIAYHRLPDTDRAMAEITRLLRLRPNDGYYHELHGQILLENGDASGAIAAYRKAVAIYPDAPLILAGLGRALLAGNSVAGNTRALAILERAYGKDPHDSRMLRDLSLAYARADKIGEAAFIAAERAALNGDFGQAVVHAKRAQGLLVKGSRVWLRAEEIIGVASEEARRRKGRRR